MLNEIKPIVKIRIERGMACLVEKPQGVVVVIEDVDGEFPETVVYLEDELGHDQDGWASLVALVEREQRHRDQANRT